MARIVGRSGLVGVSLLMALASGVAAQTAVEDPIAVHFEASFKAEEEGEIARALNEVLEVLRLRGDDYVATLRAAWLYYRKGQYDDAIVTYRKAIALARDSIEARLGLTLPLMAMGRWTETEDVCKAVLRTGPANYLALSRLAYAQYNRGAFTEAEASYRKVLALYPSDLDMMLGLGWTYTKLDRPEQARGFFEAVLRIRRTSLGARAGLEACCPLAPAPH